MRKAGGLPSSPSMVRYHIPCLGIVSSVEGCVFLATPAQSGIPNKQKFKCQRHSLFWVLADFLEEMFPHLLYALRTTSTYTWMAFVVFYRFCLQLQWGAGPQSSVHCHPGTRTPPFTFTCMITVRIPGFVQSDPILLARVKRFTVKHMTQDRPEFFTRKLLLKLGVYSSEQREH